MQNQDLPPVRITKTHPEFPKIFMLLEKYAFLKNPQRWSNGMVQLPDGKRIPILSENDLEVAIQDVYSQIEETLDLLRLPVSVIDLISENLSESLETLTDDLTLNDLLDQNPPSLDPGPL